jgi:hypothetical protein
VFEKGKKVTKNLRKNKKGLDRADIVRDFRFPDYTSIDSNVGFASLPVHEVLGPLVRGAEVLSKLLRE